MAETLDELRAGLLAPALTKDERVALLKKLVRRVSEPGVREILKEVCASEAVAPNLEYFVRAFGYFKDPAVVADVLPYMRHAKPAVVASAVKALAALDPKAAMRAAVPLIRRSKDRERVFAAASALASKCGTESRAFFRELAASPRSRHRAAALIQVKTLPPDEAIPVLLEMLASEPKPKLRKLVLDDLAERATPAHASQIATASQVLAAKARRLDDLAKKLCNPAREAPAAPGHKIPDNAISGVLGPLPVPAAAEAPAAALPPPAATASGALPRPPLPSRPSRPIPVPRPPTSPGRPTGRTPAAPSPQAGVPRRSLLLAAGGILIAALVVVLNWGGSYQAVSQGGGAAAPCPLGLTGAHVQFAATVVGGDPAARTLKLTGPGQLPVVALVARAELASLPAGRAVQVDGVLREYRTATGAIVQAFEVR